MLTMLVLKVFLTYILIKVTIGAAVPSNPSIIIIGSGPSGIAAATKLLKNNFTNIKILEAENRIGGRINSIKFGDAYVDLGAEFCHGEEGNIVYSMVKDLRILQPSAWNHKTRFMLSNGEIIKKETTEKIFEFVDELEATDEEEDCQNVSSIGECLRLRIQNFAATAQDSKEKEILTESTADFAKSHLSALDSPFDLNDLKFVTNYKTCKGDLGLHWNGLGYKTILEIMMQKYPNTENQLPIDDKIFLQKEVANISNWQNDAKVNVITTDGSSYTADHVIVTPSVGVLKAQFKTLFNPSLPQEKIDAINNIGFGAIMKVILRFADRWWKEDLNWPFLWTAKDKQELKEKNLEWLITVSGIAQAENNPNVTIVWYAGSYIPLMETLSDEQILEGQKYLINKFLATHYNVTMPVEMIRTKWYSNPHFRGTYSYESVKGHANGGTRFPDHLAEPLFNNNHHPTVLFAGEATHPHYFSTVHGAIESGYREAKRLIHLYRNSSLSALQNGLS